MANNVAPTQSPEEKARSLTTLEKAFQHHCGDASLAHLSPEARRARVRALNDDKYRLLSTTFLHTLVIFFVAAFILHIATSFINISTHARNTGRDYSFEEIVQGVFRRGIWACIRQGLEQDGVFLVGWVLLIVTIALMLFVRGWVVMWLVTISYCI